MAPWCLAGPAIVQDVSFGMPLWQALNQHLQTPVRFVPQQALPAGVAFESFIADRGCCPTREGWHDLFNGLCWQRFPATKTRLNRLQAAQIARDGVRSTRGAARDVWTVFDENAALLQAPDALWQALVAKQWARAFGDLRGLWRQAYLVLFGHALLEKLLTPRPAITAHVVRVPIPGQDLAQWDRWMAAGLDTLASVAQPFAHLPVLGVPGWWDANADRAFYADATVFRPPPAQRGRGQ